MKRDCVKSNKRYMWLDECKGIGIFLVVLGHALVFSIRTKNPYVQFMYKMIYYFHMPFMMFLSSLAYQLFSNQNRIKESILKKIKRLLVPYVSYAILVYLLIVICVHIPVVSEVFHNNGYVPENVSTFLIGLLVGNNKYAIHLWYIYMLFWFYIFVIATRRIINDKVYVIIGAVLFAIKCIVNTDNMYLINNVCTLFIWFALGMNADLDKNLNDFYKKKIYRHIALVVGIVYFACDILFIPTPKNPILYTIHTIIKFSFIYNVIVGVVFECMYAEKISRRLSLLGKNSFVIYLFHQPFFCMGITTLCAGKSPDIVAIMIGVTSSFCSTILINYILNFNCMRYAKKLFKG